MTFDLLQSIRDKAQNRIAKQLFDSAAESDSLLRGIGGAIAAEHKCIAIYAPPKELDRAVEKVMNKGGGDWYSIKDIARMTIVAPDKAVAKNVRNAILKRCQASSGMGIAKNEFGETDAGYLGVNMVVKLTNGRFGEIQINMPNMLYGKMGTESFKRDLGYTTYLNIKGRYAVRGGVGHGLYKVIRSNPGSSDAVAANAISVRYYRYLRGFPNWGTGKALDGELGAIIKRFPLIFKDH